MSHIVKADEYLRIGMEAAYAPYIRAQEDDANGAVKIDGTNQYGQRIRCPNRKKRLLRD